MSVYYLFCEKVTVSSEALVGGVYGLGKCFHQDVEFETLWDSPDRETMILVVFWATWIQCV